MKKLLYILAVLTTALNFAACGGDDEPTPDNPGNNGTPENPTPTNPTNPTDSTEHKDAILMQVSALIGADGLNYATPRLLFACDGRATAEIYDPKHPDMLMLQSIGANKDEDALVVVTKENIIFAPYNPATDKALPTEVLLTGSFNDFATLSYCTMNWETGEADFQESVPLSREGKPSMGPTTRGDNDALKKTFFDMVNYMGEEIGKISDKMDKFGKAGKAGKAVCTAYQEVVLPLMRYNLYADDEIAQKQYVEEYVQGKTKELFCKVTGIDEDYVNFALWAYNNAHRVDIGKIVSKNIEPNEYAPIGKQQIAEVTKQVQKTAAILNNTIRKNTGVEVTLNIMGVSENSIGLSGSVKIDDSSYASYLSAGFCYYQGSKEVRVKTGMDGYHIKPTNITDLEPATLYSMAAYYEPMTSSHTFYSEYQDVVTRGIIFSPATTSIDLESDGGTLEIPIKIGYKTDWKVAYAPSWCSCDKQENKLVVKVKKNSSEENRTEPIILEAKGYYGDQQSVQILVTQKGTGGSDEPGEEPGEMGNWAETKWQMRGTLTADETYNDSFVADFTGGKVSFSQGVLGEIFANSKYTAELSEKDLIVRISCKIYSNHGDNYIINCAYTFHRNGDSINCSVSGSDSEGFAITGNYTGTRIQ